MKTKAIFSIVFLVSLLAPEVFGQLTKGNFFLFASSNMSLGSDKSSNYQGTVSTETGKVSSFYLYPGAGYLLTDNLVVGLNLQLQASGTRHSSSDARSSFFSVSLGPFARYYFLAQNKLRPMAQINFGVGTFSSKYTNAGTTVKYPGSLFNFAAGVGASYFIAENVAVDCLLNYNFDHTKDGTNKDRGSKSSELLLDFGVIVTLSK